MKKKWMATVMVGMLFLSGCAGGDTPTNTTTPDANIYSQISARYEFIGSAQEMMEASTIVYTAKVTDISFTMLDHSRPPNSQSKEIDITLHTIYKISVITLYKGETDFTTIRMMGGMKDFRVEEQMTLLREYDQEYIPILDDMPEIKIGKEYLFMLWQYDQDVMPTLMNPFQGVYNLDDPFEEHPSMTAKEIISTFGKDQWNTFWSQWQKDNPGWENRLDKAAVEKALAED